jgi:UDP-2,3-diacylglucosamine pyrophosphatase LpxH
VVFLQLEKILNKGIKIIQEVKMKFLSFISMVMFMSLLTSCDKSSDNSKNTGINPFSNGGGERNMIVVISDLHLGADLAYAECNVNRVALERLIKQIKVARNVKELVIAGDLIDEWFVPATINTFEGNNQADFVRRVAITNKTIFDVINSIIQEGNIRLTYLPGNHDLAITEADIESVLPGINQAREVMLGLGTYSPIAYPKIVIEHGHRYNFFCAPDPISNQDIAPGTILPPGYFFTRIAALWVQQGLPSTPRDLPVVTPNISGTESQDLMYRYWKDWAVTLNDFPITNGFDENIIVTNVNGFTGTYSVNNFLPFQSIPSGLIDVDIYKGIQDNWEARQTLNNVAVHMSTAIAIDSIKADTWTDQQSIIQYFMNPVSDKRIVIFGHTHKPKMFAAVSYGEKKCIYANSGTWIDSNPEACNFVVITPQGLDASSNTYVKLYSFKAEVVNIMSEDSLHY